MIIDYIHSHQAGFWVALGFILLSTEVLVFGFTTIVLFFAGLAGLLTGLLMLVGVLPTNWLSGISAFGILTGVLSVLLWKPLKKMQDGVGKSQRQSSDLIGLEFTLGQDITTSQPGQYRYSGVNWRIELDHSAGVTRVSAGQRVVVASLDAGVFRVRPLQ